MSNHSVKISNSELNRLRRSSRDADAKIRRLQEDIRKHEAEVAEAQRALERQRQDHMRSLNNMVSNLASENERKLRQAGENVDAAVIGANTSLQSNLDALSRQLGEAKGNFNMVLDNYNALRDQFEAIIQAEASAAAGQKDRAAFFVNEFSDYINRMAQLNPQGDFKTDYNSLKDDLRKAKESFANGDYEASIMVSQDSTTDAAALLATVIAANAALGEVQKEGQSLALDLLAKVEGYDAKYDTSLEIDGEEYAFDMNRYSDGMLAEIKEDLESKKEALAHCGDVKQAYELYADILNLQERLEACEMYAKDEFAKSLGLELTARKIQQMMEDNWFDTTGGGFVNGDERANVLLNFENDAGNEVCISIIPGTDPKQPQLVVEAFGNDSEGTKQRVLDALKDNGYDLSDEKTDSNCHLYSDKERFAAHISQQASKEIQAVRAQNADAVKCGKYQ